MLNPETVVMRRITGVKPREVLLGSIYSDKKSDNPLMFTGAGVTTLDLDLVFDISIPGSTVVSEDVRDLTKPIWNLSENQQRNDHCFRPALCRFIWGKSWNIPGVISALSEKLESFSAEGVPHRSWLRLRMVRMQQHVEPIASEGTNFSAFENQFSETSALTDTEGFSNLDSFTSSPNSSTDLIENNTRIDLSAYQSTGDCTNWRVIANQYNLTDPLEWLKSNIIEWTESTDGDIQQ